MTTLRMIMMCLWWLRPIFHIRLALKQQQTHADRRAWKTTTPLSSSLLRWEKTRLAFSTKLTRTYYRSSFAFLLIHEAAESTECRFGVGDCAQTLLLPKKKGKLFSGAKNSCRTFYNVALNVFFGLRSARTFDKVFPHLPLSWSIIIDTQLLLSNNWNVVINQLESH